MYCLKEFIIAVAIAAGLWFLSLILGNLAQSAGLLPSLHHLLGPGHISDYIIKLAPAVAATLLVALFGGMFLGLKITDLILPLILLTVFDIFSAVPLSVMIIFTEVRTIVIQAIIKSGICLGGACLFNHLGRSLAR